VERSCIRKGGERKQFVERKRISLRRERESSKEVLANKECAFPKLIGKKNWE